MLLSSLRCIVFHAIRRGLGSKTYKLTSSIAPRDHDVVQMSRSTTSYITFFDLGCIGTIFSFNRPNFFILGRSFSSRSKAQVRYFSSWAILSNPQEQLDTELPAEELVESQTDIYIALKSGEIESAWSLYLHYREDASFRLNWFEFNHFVGRFWSKEMCERLILLFRDALERDESSMAVYEYNVWIHCLKKLGREPEMEKVYYSMKTRFGHPLPPNTYVTLLLLFWKSDWSRAKKFFEVLRIERVSLFNLGTVFLETVLVMYMDVGLLKEVDQLLDEIRQEFDYVVPSLYRTLVVKSVQSCKLKLADTYFDELVKLEPEAPSEFVDELLKSLHKIKVDDVLMAVWLDKVSQLSFIYNSSIIDTWIRMQLENGGVEMKCLVDLIALHEIFPDRRMCFLLLRLAFQSASKNTREGLLSSFFDGSFLTLYDIINYLSSEGEGSTCVQDFGAMLTGGWPRVDIKSFNLVLSQCTDTIDFNEGIIYDSVRLARKHLQLDSISYNILFRFYSSKGYLGESSKLKKWLASRHHTLPVHFYHSLMMGYLRSKRYDEVCQLGEEMKLYKVAPNLHIYAMLASSLAELKRWEEFDLLFLESISSSAEKSGPVKVDSKLMNIFLERCSRAGDVKRVKFFIKELEVRGMEVDHYSELLKAYSFHDDFPSGLRLYQDLQEKGVVIKPEFAIELINLSIRTRSLESGVRLMEELGGSVSIPFREIASAILESDDCSCEHLTSIYHASLASEELPLKDSRFLRKLLFSGMKLDNRSILKESISDFQNVDCPDDFLWETTLKALLHIEEWDQAIEFYLQCIDTYLSPLTPSFFQRMVNLLLAHFGRFAMWDRVDSVLESAKLPDIFALGILVKACLNANNPTLACHYMEFFNDQLSIPPDNVVSSMFVIYYAMPDSDNFDLESATRWFNFHPQPALASYLYLSKAHESVGNSVAAEQLMSASRQVNKKSKSK